MNRIVGAVLLLGFTSASHGITGNDLQQQCQQDTLLCTGYVRGVFDAHTSWKNTIEVSRKTYHRRKQNRMMLFFGLVSPITAFPRIQH